MNDAETELLAAVARVVAVFERLGIDYFVGGSVASSVFGEPRQTLDADLIAKLLARNVQALLEGLGSDFYGDSGSMLQAIERQSCFNLIHLATMTKVDVFVSWRSPFAQSQFSRRRRKVIGESSPVELFFASPEDTIIAKLDWYRLGGGISDRQWRDLLGVLKIQGTRLDRSYLEHWAAELGLEDLLRRAMTDAGLAS